MKIDKLDFNSIKRIGIDKLKLSGFAVENIDMKKLLSMKHKVEIVQSTDSLKHYKRHMPDSGIGISKILIKDNEIFSDLLIGCSHRGNDMPVEYVYLTICVSNAKGFNLENMTYDEYDKYIFCVLEYISSEYGITLHNDYMKVDYLEINTNIFLENKYSSYNRALRLFMSFFNNHLGKLSTYGSLKNKKIVHEESFMRGNKSVEVIFYDKIKQLKDEGLEIEGDIEILRIELRLKNRKKILSAFGSCFWHDLNQKNIVKYFTKYIYEELSKKFDKWTLEREKELKKLILDCRTKSRNKWHHVLMQEIRNKSELEMIPYILDIQQVCNAFKKLPDPHRNAKRAIKSLLSISIENDCYKNNDLEKVFEILNTLKDYSEKALKSSIRIWNFPQSDTSKNDCKALFFKSFKDFVKNKASKKSTQIKLIRPFNHYNKVKCIHTPFLPFTLLPFLH